MEKATDFVLTEDQEQKSKQEIFKYQNINNSFAKHCSNCNKSGHGTISCRLNKQSSQFYQKSQNQQNIIHFSNNQGNSSPSQNQPFRSFHSKFQNNNDSDISSKFCTYCKNKGHVVRECRKL